MLTKNATSKMPIAPKEEMVLPLARLLCTCRFCLGRVSWNRPGTEPPVTSDPQKRQTANPHGGISRELEQCQQGGPSLGHVSESGEPPKGHNAQNRFTARCRHLKKAAKPASALACRSDLIRGLGVQDGGFAQGLHPGSQCGQANCELDVFG